MTFLTLYAETAIHVGVGQELGPIDLPVHRERHTGLPFVPGHGLKGALRALAEARAQDVEAQEDPRKGAEARQELLEVFGPRAGEDLKQGNLVIYDALPLAVPFRSLQAVFVWATCPLLLERFVTRTGKSVTFTRPDEGQFVAYQAGPQPAQETGRHQPALLPDLIVVEDLDFRRARDAGHDLDLPKLVPPVVQGRVSPERVVVLADTDFVYLVRHCLPVVARVQLTAGKTTGRWVDPTNGEPEEGNLWAEEMLPPDTILYAPVGYVRGQARTVTYLGKLLHADGSIQLGGDETVGLGWCWVSLHGAPAGDSGGAQGAGSVAGTTAPAAPRAGAGRGRS